MALKNSSSVAYFKVIDVTTGKGVAGLTVAGGAFTSIKLDQDNTLGSDIQGTISLQDKGNGRYAFAVTAGQMNFDVICPIVVMVNANYEAYGVTVYTETAARAGNQMDLINAPNATAIAAIQNGLALATILAQVKGAVAGKVIVSADGLTIQKYDFAGALLVTLVRTGTGPYTWTPTWA